MVIKKAMDSEGMIVVGNSETHKLFPVGFEWRVGSIVYTVKEIINKDPHSDMRRVLSSRGDEEYMVAETIIKDLKDSEAVIISEGNIPKVDKTGKEEEKKSE